MIYDVQKAGMWKRISAYIFDFIILGIVSVGVAFLLSVVLNYDSHTEARTLLQQGYEARYQVTFDITQAEYEAMTPEARKYYDDAYYAFVTDSEVSRIDMILLNLSLIITSFGILAAYLLLEILVPLWLENGQTLGKKIFGIAVMRVDGVRLSLFQLLVRTVLGKYTVETMLPIFLLLLLVFNLMPLVSVVGIAMILVIQFVLLISTSLRTPIHDMIAGTVTVDLASQMIFDSAEELLEYKKRLHAEQVKESPIE